MEETTVQTGLRDETVTGPPSDAIDLERTALLLDVDGTLLDIAVTPARVVVPPDLRATLSDLLNCCGGAVALVSGRTIETLDRVFAPLKLPAVGGHGAEMRLQPSRPAIRRSISINDALRRRLHGLGKIDPRLLVEDKLHSVALHYRLVEQHEAFLKQEVTRLVAGDAGENEILFGKAVIEIKPKQFNKGSAVAELMTYPPFAGRNPIFIGDDTTDEAVFAVLPDLAGHGYSVGRLIEGAEGAFSSPQAVRAWLRRLSMRCGNPT